MISNISDIREHHPTIILEGILKLLLHSRHEPGISDLFNILHDRVLMRGFLLLLEDCALSPLDGSDIEFESLLNLIEDSLVKAMILDISEINKVLLELFHNLGIRIGAIFLCLGLSLGAGPRGCFRTTNLFDLI